MGGTLLMVTAMGMPVNHCIDKMTWRCLGNSDILVASGSVAMAEEVQQLGVGCVT